MLAEEIAAEWWKSQGYDALAHRWKTPFAEIDLVLGKHQTRVLCEVKTINDDCLASIRLGFGQRQRLIRAFSWCLENYSGEWSLQLALVQIRDRSVSLFEIGQ